MMKQFPIETLQNAIGVYETTLKAVEDNDEYCPALDKVTLEFLKELKAYREAEEQGLLLKLPCLLGDKVYLVHIETNRYAKLIKCEVREGKIASYAIYNDEKLDAWVSYRANGEQKTTLVTLGSTFFTTREEAETATKKIMEEWT